MSKPKDCFTKHGRQDLQTVFDTLIGSGKNEHEAAREILLREHKKLFTDLEGLKGNKKPQYTEPPSVDEKIKEINSKYEADIKAIDEKKIEVPEKPTNGNEPPKPPTTEPPKPPTSEGETVKITHERLDELGKELGFKEYEKKPETVEQWDIEARERIEKGELPKVLDKLREGRDTDHVEVRMLLHYVADLKAKLNKNPFDNKLLKDLKAAKDLIDIHNSAWGKKGKALQGEKSVSENLEDWMLEKMESTAQEELTIKQKEEVKAQFDEYKAKAAEADQKIAEKDSEIAKLKAEMEVAKNKKKVVRTKTKEALSKERKDIVQDIKDKLKKSRGETSAVIIPYAKELFSIAPDVGKLVRNLVETGTLKLEDIVDNIHELLKDSIDGLRKEDVRDIIAGKYKEERPHISEVKQNLRDIKDEARLLGELEALMNGEQPTNEKKQQQRNQRITELQNKIKDFKSEKAKAEKELEAKPEKMSAEEKTLNAIKKRNETAKQKWEERIKNKDFETQKKTPLDENALLKKTNPKLWKETMDAIDAKDEARSKFDLAKRKDELSKRSTITKIADGIGLAITTSKAIKAGIDDSSTGVQLLFAILANPKSGLKAKISAIKDVNAKHFKRELTALHNSPHWEVIKGSELDITEPQSHAKANVEELYSGNLLDRKIKGTNYWTYTGGIFERLFTSFGNNLRLNMFTKRMEYLQNQGMTFESHPQEYKAAARVINEMTGRGKINEHLQAAMPVISPIIWAPKMLSSTLNTLGLGDIFNAPFGKKGYYRSLTPQQRVYAGTQMAKAIGMGAGIMTALAVAGWDVDYDPNSVTFGTVKKGTTSYNVFGRYASFVRTAYQIVSGVKERPDGTETDLDKKGGRGVVFGRFIRGKMTPFSGIAYDYIFNKQENIFTREKMTAKTIARDMVLPISLGDMKKGLEQDGTISLLTRFLPAFEGIQVTDDRDFEGSKFQQAITIKNPTTFKERKTTPEEYKKYKETIDKKFPELLQKFKDNKSTIWVDLNGKIHLSKNGGNISDSEKATWKNKTYDKLSDEQSKDLERKVKSKVSDMAEKEIKF